ncbi:DNA polymerase Y family protein [Pseudomonas sp. MOIL14HWK12:I2]|uniref:Y-family DNA polymerase n=1 Tax=Pseudomonas sp. MOIL14HWK12:I2 TaxID=1033994 RepID=UPI00040FA3AC|nr:DNA polymerase Y family protein [Pseudomonas sp. MOIL14HWK12:I2]
MRWACILFPQLALDAVLRRHPQPERPLVLLSGPPQRRLLQAVNPAARALGLRPGLTLAAAQALTRDFEQQEYDPALIETAEALLAAWGYGFSSQVSRHYPRALLLEIQSSLPLLGPWPRLERRLRQELQGLGFRHRLALAPNPVAARMLTNVADGLIASPDDLPCLLDRLPVERAGFAPQQAQALVRMGIRRLEQLKALPRPALARRFAPELLQQLDLLGGSRSLALEFYRPPDRFVARVELNFEVESHQALLFPLRRLTADLAVWLASRDRGVQRFLLWLEHRQGPATTLTIGLLAPERDAALLFEFARGRLEQLQVVAPVLALRLESEELPLFVPERHGLFDERPAQAVGWEVLRERLRARLGEEAVLGLGIQADHRPERALVWRHERRLETALPGLRPGWLLSEPRPLDGQPRRVLAGPERIESGWWDGGDQRRDYYRIEVADGRQAWAFRRYGEEAPWWIQGWFA